MDFNGLFIERLAVEYRNRRSRNPAYSLRSYARDLKLNSGRLSQYFSGKRIVTQRSALKIMERLGWSPQEQSATLGALLGAMTASTPKDPVLLNQRTFELISEPIHFTLMSLIETTGFRNNARWIAARLRSSVPEVVQSLKLLEELGMVARKGSKLVVTQATGFRSSDGVKNAALRKAHEQQLKQAISSLESVPLEFRDITSITMATDPEKLEQAKALIKEFRRKMSALLEGENKTEVFRLQIQLIPLTEVQKENFQ